MADPMDVDQAEAAEAISSSQHQHQHLMNGVPEGECDVAKACEQLLTHLSHLEKHYEEEETAGRAAKRQRTTQSKRKKKPSDNDNNTKKKGDATKNKGDQKEPAAAAAAAAGGADDSKAGSPPPAFPEFDDFWGPFGPSKGGKKGGGFAKGTGYSNYWHANGPVWDPEQAEKKQKEMDAAVTPHIDAMTDLLDQLQGALVTSDGHGHGNENNNNVNMDAGDADGDGGEGKKGEIGNGRKGRTKKVRGKPVPTNIEELEQLLHESRLQAILTKHLTLAFTEMCQRVELFTALFGLLRSLSSLPTYLSRWPPALHTHLRDLRKSANLLVKSLKKQEEAAEVKKITKEKEIEKEEEAQPAAAAAASAAAAAAGGGGGGFWPPPALDALALFGSPGPPPPLGPPIPLSSGIKKVAKLPVFTPPISPKDTSPKEVLDGKDKAGEEKEAAVDAPFAAAAAVPFVSIKKPATSVRRSTRKTAGKKQAPKASAKKGKSKAKNKPPGSPDSSPLFPALMPDEQVKDADADGDGEGEGAGEDDFKTPEKGKKSKASAKKASPLFKTPDDKHIATMPKKGKVSSDKKLFSPWMFAKPKLAPKAKAKPKLSPVPPNMPAPPLQAALYMTPIPAWRRDRLAQPAAPPEPTEEEKRLLASYRALAEKVIEVLELVLAKVPRGDAGGGAQGNGGGEEGEGGREKGKKRRGSMAVLEGDAPIKLRRAARLAQQASSVASSPVKTKKGVKRKTTVDNAPPQQLGTSWQEIDPSVYLAAGPKRRREEASSASGGGPGSEEEYISALKDLLVDHAELSDTHLHMKHCREEKAEPQQRMMRVSKELAGLGTLLPLHRSSSIFVRYDEKHTNLWRALIVGPEDTPYDGGCFLFDVYFDVMYPTKPPKVLLRTTGGGRIGFNPNLYADGTVCLSLLGTWQGGKGESWDSQISTAFQVLVSIQSLIFVAKPWFNEPGYEAQMGTTTGDAASDDYNRRIRDGTVKYAMVDLLKSPPPEFADVIKRHFKLRQQHVVKTAEAWAAARNATLHKSDVATLKQLLDAL